MSLDFIDLSIVIFYFSAIIFIGFIIAGRSEKNDKTDEDFILAGRRVTLPFFIASLVSTWYGGILGVGEFVYSSGIVAWVSFGLPYYIAGILFAIFLSEKIRNANVTTIPDQIEKSYGKLAGRVSSFIILIITIPASYILMLGVIIAMFSGWSIELSIIIGSVLSLAYLFTGGFKADVFTNAAQFIVMYIGFGALLFFTMNEFGSISEMWSNLPNNFKTPTGDLSWQYVLAWYIIAFQTFVDPSFHQRCSAAKTPKTARNGILISVGFWIIFDFFTIVTGLYAKAYLPIDEALMAYPILAETVLPSIWKGLFVTALLATVMSTLDSYAFISAATIGNDLLKPMFRKKQRKPAFFTRIGLIITGIVGVVLAILIPSVVDLIYKTASIAVPGLLVPLVISMSKKYYIIPKNVIKIMLSSSLISLFWMILHDFAIQPFNMVEPMMPGIIFSLLFALFIVKKNEAI